MSTVEYLLRLTERQHAELRQHLFPGDGNEAVALLLCGRHVSEKRHVFTARRVHLVPNEICRRLPDRVTWSTSAIDEVLSEAYAGGLAIVKVHSHSAGHREFSSYDDQSDRAIYGSISALIADGNPHASLIMLPNGELLGRAVEHGHLHNPLSSVTVVGDDIRIWPAHRSLSSSAFTLRHAQAFGKGTVALLHRLAVAVVGCSGTGSIVIEQLARLGVGRLVLIDPDYVEEKNLNRIVNAGKEDAYVKRLKVHTLAMGVARMGLETEVTCVPVNLASREAVLAVADSDLVFSCMDGVEGRHLLNRLSTFYNLPYIDVGVRLDADDAGGVRAISGAVHYLQPGRSSLLNRGVYTMAQVEAEETRRTNPAMYERQRGEGYLRGVNEDRPAVISVNMFFASLAVNEMLARLHPYRNQPNGDYAYIGGSLSELQFYAEPEGERCPVLRDHVGRGDTTPLLDRASLS